MGSGDEFIELNIPPEFRETPIDRVISKAQTKSPIPFIAFTSAAVLFCIFGFGLTLLLYLCVCHTTSTEGSTLVTTAPIQFITAITQALSTCVARSIPIVVSVYAYSIAAEWLTISQLSDSPERLNALHLGLLMTVVQGASTFSWIATAAQVLRLKRSRKQEVQSVPGILHRSLWVIGSLLLLSYLISGFDTWLHVFSTAEFTQYEQPYASEDIFFGKEINETRCAYYAAKNPTSFLGPVCGLFQPEIHGSDVSASATEAILTMGNASTSNFIQLTDDQHAILVPAALPPRIAYNASTIGVKSQCRSLTRQCLDASAMAGSFPSFHCPGPQPILVNNTILAAFPDINGVISGVRTPTGGIAYTSADQYSFQATTTNPFQFVTVQLSQIFAVANQSQSQFIGNSGFFYTSAHVGTAYNLITCDVSVRTVAYEYRDMSLGESSSPIPKFTTQSYWMSDIRITKLLATLLDTGWVTVAVSARSLGAANEPGSGFEEAFARALSISMLASSASIFKEARALNAVSLKPVLVSKIPLMPLIGFGIIVFAFLCWIVVLSMSAAQGAWSTSLTHLGQMSLTSPQCTLHHFLPNVQADATWSSNSTKLFDNEDGEDGLVIGHYPSPKGGSVFGIGHAVNMQLLKNTPLGTQIGLDSKHPSKNFATTSALAAFSTPISDKQTRPLPLALLVVTLASLAALLSLVTFLLIYILPKNQYAQSGGLLQTTASLSYILAVSQSISTLISLTIAPLMGLHAFHVASVWANITETSEAPLPSELCRLFYVIQGASLWSFARQHHLKAKTPRIQGGRRPRSFRMVSEAVRVLGCLLLLSNLVVVVDNWFHISSSSFPITSYSQEQSSDQTLFGRQIDVSRCSQYSTSATNTNVTAIRQLCGILTDDGVMSTNAIAEAQRTWSNTSTTNRIAMTQDQHAILVPANLPETIRYQATTIGVQATCESITRRCVDNASPQNQEQWATWGVPWFNCSGSPPINANNSLLQTGPWIGLFGILDPVTGNIVDGNSSRAYEVADSSPLQMVMAAVSVAGQEPGHSTSYFTDNGFTFSPEAFQGAQLLHCTVAINEVQYQYDGNDSTFITLSTRNVSTQTTKMVMASTDNFEMANVVSLLAEVLYSAQDYSATYARQLSSILLADVTLAFSATAAEKVWHIEPTLGSQLRILPLAIFLLLTGIFCVIVILIVIRTASHWDASPIARMAHDRFMSPLPIMMQLFGPVDAMRLAEGSEARRRLEELDDKRLNIGPLETRDGCLFTVYKASSLEGRYGEGKASTAFSSSPFELENMPSRSSASTWETSPRASKHPPMCRSSTEAEDDSDDNSSIKTFYLPAIGFDSRHQHSCRSFDTFSSSATLGGPES